MLKFENTYSYIGCRKGSRIDPREVGIVTFSPENLGVIVITGRSLLTAGRGLALWMNEIDDHQLFPVFERIKAGETEAAHELIEPITDDSFRVLPGPRANVYSYFQGVGEIGNFPYFAGEITVSPRDVLEIQASEVLKP